MIRIFMLVLFSAFIFALCGGLAQGIDSPLVPAGSGVDSPLVPAKGGKDSPLVPAKEGKQSPLESAKENNKSPLAEPKDNKKSPEKIADETEKGGAPIKPADANKNNRSPFSKVKHEETVAPKNGSRGTSERDSSQSRPAKTNFKVVKPKNIPDELPLEK